MKVAKVKLSWRKSPSSDLAKVEIIVDNGGNVTTTVLGPDVEQFMVDVEASKTLNFKILTYDMEGYVSTSELYAFTLGDLEAPLPATNLSHEVISVEDVPV